MDRNISRLRRYIVASGFAVAGVMGISPAEAQELCGGVDYPFPYTDVSSVGAAFCPGIMEAYVTGVSKGTSPTTFNPTETVTRVQMTTFLQRSLDQGLARTSRRAALNQWWVPQNSNSMQVISVGGQPVQCAADGADIWTANLDEVVQVQANTGAILGTWTAEDSGFVVVAAGKVYVAASLTPGVLYVIDPTLAPGPVTISANTLGNDPNGLAFDGTNLWTANFGPPGSVSIITPQSPYTVTTVTTGFNNLDGILYDGANIWVTDVGAGKLLQLDDVGDVIQTVVVGASPGGPVFDGTNIWVPNQGSNSITVVQASTGKVVATISHDASNQLDGPLSASFDGERILVTNRAGGTVSIFKAADLSFIANVTIGASAEPFIACSDGINFWVPVVNTGNLVRF